MTAQCPGAFKSEQLGVVLFKRFLPQACPFLILFQALPIHEGKVPRTFTSLGLAPFRSG